MLGKFARNCASTREDDHCWKRCFAAAIANKIETQRNNIECREIENQRTCASRACRKMGERNREGEYTPTTIESKIVEAMVRFVSIESAPINNSIKNSTHTV